MMVLHFEEEIVLAQYVAVLVRQAAGIVVFLAEDRLRNVAAQASRHADQSGGVSLEQVQINPRLVVEAIEICGGD